MTQALLWGVTLVDASDTLLALHQTGLDGNKAGWNSSDKCTNRDLIGPYVYDAGRTTCAKWRTQKDFTGDIRLVRRSDPERPSICWKENKIGYNGDVRNVATSPPDISEGDALLAQLFPPAEDSIRRLNLPWAERKGARKLIHHLWESVGGKDNLDHLTSSQKEWLEKALRKSKLIEKKQIKKDTEQDKLNQKAIAQRRKKTKSRRTKVVKQVKDNKQTNAATDKVLTKIDTPKQECRF